MFYPSTVSLVAIILLFLLSVSNGFSTISMYSSPNYDERLIGVPDTIVLHQSNSSCATTLDQLTKPSTYSVHYLVCTNGTIYRLVEEASRAWHSGYSYWHSRLYLDDWSIGIQIDQLVSSQLIQSLIALIKDVRTRWTIPDTLITSIYDVAMDRSNIPHAPKVPWLELSHHGIGIYVGSPKNISPVSVNTGYHLLKSIGYYENSQGSVFPNRQFNATLIAFQTRFMPDRLPTGILDVATYSMLNAIKKLHDAIMVPFWKCYVKLTPNPGWKPLTFNTSFPSRNQNDRLLGPPTMVVIHDTEENLTKSIEILQGVHSARASIHYIVAKDGTIYKLVNETRRAWHAGAAYWHGWYYLNDISIGIEIINLNSAECRYTAAQIQATINLIIDIRTRWYIPDHFILSHEDITPLRRSDPGAFFPWSQLGSNGIGLMPPTPLPTAPPMPSNRAEALVQMHQMLKRIGYRMSDQNAPEIDIRFNASLRRFQWRFFPNVTNWNMSTPTIPALFKGLTVMNEVYRKNYAADSKRCQDILHTTSTTEASTSTMSTATATYNYSLVTSISKEGSSIIPAQTTTPSIGTKAKPIPFVLMFITTIANHFHEQSI